MVWNINAIKNVISIKAARKIQLKQNLWATTEKSKNKTQTQTNKKSEWKKHANIVKLLENFLFYFPHGFIYFVCHFNEPAGR